MAFTFRPATREGVGLLIGLVGASGSGKTYSAMRLAAGICGDKPFAVIDTEAGRAKHYADRFRFDHGDMDEPFSPAAYAEAITAADKAGYPAIVIDSMSHEHAGVGGLLHWHEAELERMAGDNWQKRDAVNMAAWIKPKGAHQDMIMRLLRVRAHLILCFRAKEKLKMAKDAKGKTVIVPDGWRPVSEKTLPYELTVSLLMTPDAPGVPQAIKLQEQHRDLFPLDRPITEDAGRRIAAWAKAGETPPPVKQAPDISKMVRAFKALGVDEAGMAEHLGRGDLADLDDEEVVKLREHYAARKAEAVEVEI